MSGALSNNSPGDVELTSGAKKSGKQRFKPQLSCTFCRNRKYDCPSVSSGLFTYSCRLKCDRALPCDQCCKRKMAPTCSYLHANLPAKNSNGSVQKTNVPKDIDSQIKNLESMVLEFMEKTNRSAESNSATSNSPASGTLGSEKSPQDWQRIENEAPDSFGRISVDDEQPNYVG